MPLGEQTTDRSIQILPNFANRKVLVHNGKQFRQLSITEEMVRGKRDAGSHAPGRASTERPRAQRESLALPQGLRRPRTAIAIVHSDVQQSSHP